MRSNLLNFQTLEGRIIVLRIRAVCPSFLLPGLWQQKYKQMWGKQYFFQKQDSDKCWWIFGGNQQFVCWSPPGEWFPECWGECQAKIWLLRLSQLLICAHIPHLPQTFGSEKNIPGIKVWLPWDVTLIFNWYFKAQHINSFKKTFRTFGEITQWNLMSVMQWIV